MYSISSFSPATGGFGALLKGAVLYSISSFPLAIGGFGALLTGADRAPAPKPPGPLARPSCPTLLPGPLARPSCPALLPGPPARPSCPGLLPGLLVRPSCPGLLLRPLLKNVDRPALLPGGRGKFPFTVKCAWFYTPLTAPACRVRLRYPPADSPARCRALKW